MTQPALIASFRVLGVVTALTLLATACGGSARVASLRATTPEAHNYRMFALVEHPVNADAFDPYVRSAIRQRMLALGYTEAAPEEADLHVQYGLLLSRTDAAVPNAPPPGADSHGAVMIASDMDGAEMTQKVLLVLMSERGTSHLVWMGVSTADVAGSELEAATLRAVGRVMEEAPRAGRWDDSPLAD